jgi:hypothetical protein
MEYIFIYKESDNSSQMTQGLVKIVICLKLFPLIKNENTHWRG